MIREASETEPTPILELSPALIDFLRGLEALSARPLDHGLHLNVGSRWSELAREATAEQRLSADWIGAGTLIAAAPASIPSLEIHERVDALAAQRHAERRGDILPAGDDPSRFTAYREWFAECGLIDEGEVEALARFSPGLAAAVGVEVIPADVSYVYRDDADELSLRRRSHELLIPVDIAGFLGLMHGLAPEQAIALMCLKGVEILRRLGDLETAVHRAALATPAGFLGSLPAWRTASGVLVDSVGAEFVECGVLPSDYEARIRAAVADPLAPLCTCREPWGVRAVLRPGASVHSFDSVTKGSAPLFDAIEESHVLIYESACSHVARRASGDAWRAAGWSHDTAKEQWLATSIPSQVVTASRHGVFGQATLLHGGEIAAASAAPVVLSGLARRLGYPARSRVHVYAPFANVLFLTDEFHMDDLSIADSLVAPGGLLDRLETARGLSPGARLEYHTEMVIRDVPKTQCELVDVETS